MRSSEVMDMVAYWLKEEFHPTDESYDMSPPKCNMNCRQCPFFIPKEKFEEWDMLDLLDESDEDVIGWCEVYYCLVRRGRM